MNIEFKTPRSLLQSFFGRFAGNPNIIEHGTYQHYKRKGNATGTPKAGEVLTGYFIDPNTGKEVFGSAMYLGDGQTPNYKLLNFTILP